MSKPIRLYLKLNIYKDPVLKKGGFYIIDKRF